MLGLAPRLVAKLKEQGITEPTPIQSQAIPHAMNGRDVMGLAQTGTGKTAAFGLPMIDALMKAGVNPSAKTARGLILAPTRELAKQIADNLTNYTQGSHLKVALVVGGAGIGAQIKRLERGVDLLVATPGRLIDLIDRRAVRLDETIYLVLDEADQMLDMGFIHALRKIAPLLATPRQTMMFSATMPKLMSELASSFLKDPMRVQVNPPGMAVKKISQSLHYVAQAAKSELLVELLDAHRDELALVLAGPNMAVKSCISSLNPKGSLRRQSTGTNPKDNANARSPHSNPVKSACWLRLMWPRVASTFRVCGTSITLICQTSLKTMFIGSAGQHALGRKGPRLRSVRQTRLLTSKTSKKR